MNKELTNDENIRNLNKRKKLRILIIIFALLTCVLAILTLITTFIDVGFKFSFAFALISYLISLYFRKKRDSIEIIKNKEIEEVRKEIKKNKINKQKK